MKERPILFSAPMVRAILDGNKTQTRRVVIPQPTIPPSAYPDPELWFGPSPYGIPGDRLWVRETFTLERHEDEPKVQPGHPIYHHESDNTEFDPEYWLWPHYKATDPAPELCYEDDENDDGEPKCKWRPSIHMPRWASRILLEIVNIRVERVQEISYSPYLSDVLAEGIKAKWFDADHVQVHHPLQILNDYKTLWDSLNFKRGFGWETNPWVWVIEFKRIEENHG